MSDGNGRNGADLQVKVAGQELNLRNVKSLNTLATVATLLCVILVVYALYTHASESKEAGRELVQALKDMTQAAREQNCLIAMPMDRRDPELCKRLAR